MSEITFERRIEEVIASQVSEGAGVVSAVAKGAGDNTWGDEDDEQPGFMHEIFVAAKVKANTILRRLLEPRR